MESDLLTITYHGASRVWPNFAAFLFLCYYICTYFLFAGLCFGSFFDEIRTRWDWVCHIACSALAGLVGFIAFPTMICFCIVSASTGMWKHIVNYFQERVNT